jgi:TetR/AcrR family transcriptional repressor of nem operon
VSVRKRIEALLDAYRERLLPFMPGQTREEKLVKCQLLFPSMAGGVDDGPRYFRSSKA